MRVTAVVLLLLLIPLPGALAGPPPKPDAAAWIVAAPGRGGVLLQHAPAAKREVASLTKLMTAHLALRYARLDQVVAAGGDAVAVGESAVPLQLGERQTVNALLAALIVHSANDASVVLAHAVMQQPAAQRAVANAAKRQGRALPADPVARFVLLMNAEARRLGLRDTAYRTPHGLDEPGAHSSARDVLALARIDMASPVFRRLAGQRTVAIPGHRLQTSNTLLSVYAGLNGVKTGHTDEAGWNLAASADRNGVRMYAILLGAPGRGDARPRHRAPARLGLRSLQARPASCAPASRSGARATSASSPRGDSRRRSTRASRCASASSCRCASIATWRRASGWAMSSCAARAA